MTRPPRVNQSAARELLVDLVSIRSPSGEEDAAARRLVEFFRAHGREAWLDAVGNVRAPADDGLLLTSHVDTVPGDLPVEITASEYDDEDPLRGGNALWGRGSVDATGSLAAMAVAAVRTGVSFAGVVGEETDSRGARHLVADRTAVPGAVVNGEPSGWDGITLGYRGFLAGTYAGSTPAGHSSRPVANAIEQAMAWWSRVERALADAVEEPDAVFESVTTKPVAVRGGLADDGQSVTARMDVQFRVPPGLGADSQTGAVEQVREVVEGVLETGTLEWNEPIPPVMVSARTPLARAFRVAIRDAGGEARLLRKTGTSDMNLYAVAWDCPMVTYGPGDAALDHAPNEHLALEEYDRSIAVLEGVANRLLETETQRNADREAEAGPIGGDRS